MTIGWGNYEYGYFSYGHGTANVVTTVTGQQITASQGSLSIFAGATGQPVGQIATYGVGSPSVTGDMVTSVSGLQATYALTPPQINVHHTVIPNGQQAEFSQGTISVTGGASVTPTGQVGTYQLGEVVADAGAITSVTGHPISFFVEEAFITVSTGNDQQTLVTSAEFECDVNFITFDINNIPPSYLS